MFQQSKHELPYDISEFILQYFLLSSSYNQALMYLRNKEYGKVVPACNSFLQHGEAVNGAPSSQNETQFDRIGARLLRGTFLMLSKNFDEAKKDFDCVILHPLSPPIYRQENFRVAGKYTKRALNWLTLIVLSDLQH
jgi:hypothetical protein